ncbi:MAG TPA: N-formylglutamate amidohydrolase [Chryseosolibacter sp.]|nr:N-formylglutamate amidohydrolase [Chryseosolibacter sp.]
MKTFQVTIPSGKRVPILLSVPHCGTTFPDEIKDHFKATLTQTPDDTDWYVDKLYDFAPAIGITMITAEISRWVIDLNRSPDDEALYHDGRMLTGLCPVTTFLGDPLYRDHRTIVSPEEVKRRMDAYYNPYHEKLRTLLTDLRMEFGSVLLWDCHSIRQSVPTIQAAKFPDLILGSADGTSASPELIAIAVQNLDAGGYSFRHNHPFKGGYITRHYGEPDKSQHALQLEMTKVNYMDDSETQYHPARAGKMAELLNKTLSSLIATLI